MEPKMEINLDLEIEATETKCSLLLKKFKSLESEYEKAKQEHTKALKKLEALQKLKTEQKHRQNQEYLKKNLNAEWIEREFEWTDQIKCHIKDVFKFDEFRPKQLAAINATLSKKDVIVVIPTGGGKSLIYQMPALIEEGFTLVISPLISLIEDQLIALNKIGIHAATINSTTSKADSNEVYEEMTNSHSILKLMYVTPEWVAKSKKFMSVLKKCYDSGRVSRVAVDEVHCCSTWGHDFRPDYTYLGILRMDLIKVPFLGLTATATSSVLTDIQNILALRDCMIITAPFNRPNLFYKVTSKYSTSDETLDYLEELMKNKYEGQTGIIYTNTIKDSIKLATELKNRGLKVAPYHAQLEPDVKKSVHNKWLEKKYQAVIATIAFGMGIDKPDVRFVIHHTIPKSMESLYQESGRAGRDGKKADCIVLFSLYDFLKVIGMVSSLVEEKKAFSILEYCLDEKSCRRALIAKHFEETWDKSHCNKMCDVCKIEKDDFEIYNITEACVQIHELIALANSSGEKLTLNKLLDGWFQTGSKKLRITGMKKLRISRRQGEVIIAYLLLQKYLKIDKGYNTYSTICYVQRGKSVDNDTIEMSSRRKLLGFPKKNEECDGPAPKKQKALSI